MKPIHIVILITLLLALVLGGVLIFRSTETPQETEEREEREREEELETEEIPYDERLKEVVESFIGLPQKSGALDEDTLYTENGFDSTTLVLSSVAKTHSEEDPEEVMKKINYYPSGEVSYENRLHYSTYRNKVSEYFSDITERVGGNRTEKKTVLLNKDRLIDIDWEEEIELTYISSENVFYALPQLPFICGVMFIADGDEEIGLDVRGEGILLNGVDMIYASSKEGEVVKVKFLDYLDESGFSGVIFYEFIEVE